MKNENSKKQYDIKKIEKLFTHITDILLIYFEEGLMKLTRLPYDDTIVYDYLYTGLELIKDGYMPNKIDTLMKCEFIDTCRNCNPTSQDILELVIVFKLIPYIQTGDLDAIYDMVTDYCQGNTQCYFVDKLYNYVSDGIKKLNQLDIPDEMIKYSITTEIPSKILSEVLIK